MNVSRPTATLYIQKASQWRTKKFNDALKLTPVPNIVAQMAEYEEQDAIVLKYDAVEFEGEVHLSSVDGRTLSVLQLEIPGAGDSLLAQFKQNGFIRLDAGYESAMGDVSSALSAAPAPIFSGSMDIAYKYRSGPDGRLVIHATSSSSRFDTVYVPLVATSSPPVTYGMALRRLFEGAGARVLYPKFLDTFFLTDFIATKSALESAREVIARLNNMLDHRVVRSPLGKNTIEPGSAPVTLETNGHTFFVLFTQDPRLYLLDPRTAGVAIPEIEIDETKVECESSPVLTRGTSQFANRTYQASRESDNQDPSYMEYRVSMPLDPRVSLGLRVNMKGGLYEGPVLVTDVIHDTKTWTTQFQGPFVEAF